MKKFLIVLILSVCCLRVGAQSFQIGTNFADWANLGTANLEMGVSVGQHFSLMAGGRYNPWTMTSKRHDCIVKNQQQTGYLGLKFWPWYVYSGWWLGAKGQYSKICNTGVWRPDLEEGTAVGGGLSGGYAVMIGKHLNLDFGIGMWAGKYLDYARYECSDCLDLITSGPRGFLLLDDLTISFSFIF